MDRPGGLSYPISTVGKPITIEPPCAVMSPSRAAGRPQTSTVTDAFTITSGGPTHTHISVARACGIPPVSTVRAQGGRICPPTCGMGGTPGVTIGQTCISPARAAGIPILRLFPPQFDSLYDVHALIEIGAEFFGGFFGLHRNRGKDDRAG